MKVFKEKNILSINGKSISFDNDIETLIEFSTCCIVLLMDDVIPDNNIVAFDYNGNKIWNISEILSFPYPEAYVALSKKGEKTFKVISYSGVKYGIDVLSLKVVSKNITK